MPQMFPMPILVLSITVVGFVLLSTIRFFWHWKYVFNSLNKQLQAPASLDFCQTW